jgi:hypothetical protein
VTKHSIPTFFLGIAFVACTPAEPSPDPVDAGAADSGPADAGPIDIDALIGAFNIELVAPVPPMNGSAARAGYTSIVGRVSTAATPSPIIWETSMSEGGCTLLIPRVPYCETPCGGSAACVEDDVCTPYPRGQSVGTVRIDGLRTVTGPAQITMSPIAFNYQTPAGVTLDYPAFSEADPIHLAAEGSAVEAFTIDSLGIAPLALAAGTITIEPDVPLDLHWTAPSRADIGRITIKLDLSHHGGSKGKIECDIADVGALQISAPMMTALFALGVAGYPSVIVTRVATHEVQTAQGRIELRVASAIEKFVEIPGLVSCSGDGQCTAPATCQPDLTCR